MEICHVMSLHCVCVVTDICIKHIKNLSGFFCSDQKLFVYTAIYFLTINSFCANITVVLTASKPTTPGEVTAVKQSLNVASEFKRHTQRHRSPYACLLFQHMCC